MLRDRYIDHGSRHCLLFEVGEREYFIFDELLVPKTRPTILLFCRSLLWSLQAC